MKTALLLSGQPRFTHDFTLQLEQLVSQEPIDIWCAFWLPESLDTASDYRTKMWTPPTWRYEIDYAWDWISSRLPSSACLKNLTLLNPDEYPMGTLTYKEFYCNSQALWRQYQALKALGMLVSYKGYDMIIRSRADLALFNKIDLDQRYLQLQAEPQTLVIPDSGRTGRDFQDQWALGLTDTMTKYINCVDHFDRAHASGAIWNPEHIVSWVLQDQGITWPKQGIESALRHSGHCRNDLFIPNWGVWQ
jgi:hypothetical protein